jgi:hypothetical protein
MEFRWPEGDWPRRKAAFRGPRRPLRQKNFNFLKCRPRKSLEKEKPIKNRYVRTFRQRIAEILLYSNYEKTGPAKLACEVNLRPVRQTDPGKLAREADLPPASDNALVLDQKERSGDVLAI